jgi:ATP-dependent helicase/nuclease subunit B
MFLPSFILVWARYKTKVQFSPSIAAAIEAGDTVIASSARAARALRRMHAESQRNEGLTAWPSPDILDWESWLNRLWNRKVRSGLESRLLLTPLQEQQVWVRLVKPAIEGRRLISPAGVADLAQDAYALLHEYRAFEFLSPGQADGPDVESFRDWARDFERACRNEGWLSRSTLPLALGDAVPADQLEAPPKVLLIGFDRVTPSQQSVIEAFRAQGRAMEMNQSTEIVPAEPKLLVAAVDKRDEIAACALWVRGELAALGPAARIAVVAPGVATVRAEIDRVFRQVLAPAAVAISARSSLPYEFSLGVSLEEVPMARSALLLLRWMEQELLPDQVSWLLLSGFLCEEQDELLPLAEFDVKMRSRAMRQPEQDLDNFLRSAPPDKLRRGLQHARRLLSQNDSLNFAQWVHLAEQILEAVHWPGAHVLENEDFQVQARWTHLLDSVAALTFDGRMVSYKEFIEVLEHQARQTIFAAESQDAPIQILGPFEAAGLTFDALWFLGADDASWPAVARPHPFLPPWLQRAHNMPHADSTTDWKLAQQVTTRLERSAAKCVFSFPLQNANGVCRPSTLVTSGTVRIDAKELRASIGAEEYLTSEQFPVLQNDDEPAAILPWPVELDAGGAEILKRQAACAFQSFATRRLGARPMDATDWGLEPRDRGSVVHEILAGLWDALKTHDALLAARADNSLHAMVQEHVALGLKKYRERTLEHSWSQAYLDAEQERIISLMEDWLEFEADRAGFTVEAGEKKLPAAVGDLKLQVRVDRIDAVDGGRVIIDYKTGMLAGVSWDGPRPDEPQLPLYAGFGEIEDLKGVLLARVRDDMMKFIGRVDDAKAVMPSDSKLAKPPYDAAMLQSWRSTLLDLGQQFLRGEAQVNPKQYPKTCEFCDLSPLCRIAENDPVSSGDETDETDE